MSGYVCLYSVKRDLAGGDDSRRATACACCFSAWSSSSCSSSSEYNSKCLLASALFDDVLYLSRILCSVSVFPWDVANSCLIALSLVARRFCTGDVVSDSPVLITRVEKPALLPVSRLSLSGSASMLGNGGSLLSFSEVCGA